MKKFKYGIIRDGGSSLYENKLYFKNNLYIGAYRIDAYNFRTLSR